MPATELWLVYSLAFGAVLLGVQGAYWFFSRIRNEKKAINRRLALSQNLANPVQVLETLRRERGLVIPSGMWLPGGLKTLLPQTGLRIEFSRLMIVAIVLGTVLVLAFKYLIGLSVIAAMALAIAVAFAGLYFGLLRLRKKRIARFGEQLPDSFDVIVRGLRAGHPFRVAVGLVARELPDPIGSEFGILADEIQYGLDLPAAVDNLVHRVGAEDLQFFAVAVKIQSQTGGSLAEILARLARMVRSRAKLRLKVRALTSEGRLSAVFLSLAPFILIGIITLIHPSYFSDVLDHAAFVPAVMLGLGLLAIGNIVMYRMVNFKV
jgi:tight adherence protein B